MDHRSDVLVLGAGSAGVAAAERARSFGALQRILTVDLQLWVAVFGAAAARPSRSA